MTNLNLLTMEEAIEVNKLMAELRKELSENDIENVQILKVGHIEAHEVTTISLKPLVADTKRWEEAKVEVTIKYNDYMGIGYDHIEFNRK
jgi:hypothetical protein